MSYAYSYYDASGNNNNRIRRITDNQPGGAAWTTDYTYDQYNRLTYATASAFWRYYAYDEWGNLTTSNITQYTYQKAADGAPTTNRITSDTAGGSYGYDAAGDQTSWNGQTFSYDGARRLKTASNGTSSYGYDGNSARVRATASGTALYSVRSSVTGQTALEVTGSGVQRAYVYHGSKLVALQGPDGNFYWQHSNHLGSALALTDVNGTKIYGAQHDPYGQVIAEWAPNGNLNTRKFTGYERDAATGLDYANARMFGSAVGRFTSPDPIGLKAADLKQPESLNQYAYTRNDPINFIDRTGTLLANPNEYGGPGLCGPGIFSSNSNWFLPRGGDYGGYVLTIAFGGMGLCNTGGGGNSGGNGNGGSASPSFDARIAFLSTTDRSTKDKATFNSLGQATIKYPDPGFCELTSRRIVIIEFSFADITQINPLREGATDLTPSLSIVEVRGNLRLLESKLDVNYSTGRGTITAEVTFVKEVPETDRAFIKTTIVGERRSNSPNVSRNVEVTGSVNLTCEN